MMDFTAEQHRSALMEAVESDDFAKVQSLISNGVSVDILDSGFEIIREPVMAGEVSIFRALVAAGFSPSLTGPNGETLLMVAAEFPHVETVEELLSYDFDVNERDNDGFSALLNAVRSADSSGKVVDALLAAGADPSQQHPIHDRTASEQARESPWRTDVISAFSRHEA